MRVVVVGAGAMGLAAAHHAAKAGHAVTVVEAGAEPGGMAAHFDFGGLSLERYYHFVCRPDRPTFELMAELGIGDQMVWKPTSMGYFIDGRLHRWGDPVALLRFPGLGLLSKLRYGALMFLSAKRSRWDALERVSAERWITRWCGRAVYERLWRPLFELKFYQHAADVSAAWIWTRIHRIGNSRRSMMQEELGHIAGGTETLVKALVEHIEARGGRIRLGEPALEVVVERGRVAGVRTARDTIPAEAVICTVPTPLVSRLIPGLPAEDRARYDAILNIGVACLVFKLRRSVTPHFWVNIAEPGIPVPGLIEFSNLRETGDTIVYVPYYMPTTEERWSWSDAALLDEAFAAIRRVNPQITEADRIDGRVARLRHAQPLCPPGFAAMIPPVQTAVRGLQVADTCFYYPEDRGISESVRLGKAMADALGHAVPAERADAAAAP